MGEERRGRHVYGHSSLIVQWKLVSILKLYLISLQSVIQLGVDSFMEV